jgi:hypothetical protein
MNYLAIQIIKVERIEVVSTYVTVAARWLRAYLIMPNRLKPLQETSRCFMTLISSTATYRQV